MSKERKASEIIYTLARLRFCSTMFARFAALGAEAQNEVSQSWNYIAMKLEKVNVERLEKIEQQKRRLRDLC